MDKPIFCSLSESELLDRRKTVLDSLKQRAVSTTRIPSGIAYEFPTGAEISTEIHRIVQLEQQCCTLLTFTISENEHRIRLDVTGPDKAIAFIEELFGDADFRAERGTVHD
jgi:hypothetical protein